MYDRQERYRDPPDPKRRDALYRDRRDVDRAPEGGHDGHPHWRGNTGAQQEDLGYQDQPHAREVIKPEKKKAVVVPVESILDKPGRDSRPDRVSN
jgi:hypothetical protein